MQARDLDHAPRCASTWSTTCRRCNPPTAGASRSRSHHSEPYRTIRRLLDEYPADEQHGRLLRA
jgi:hypothetical protein